MLILSRRPGESITIGHEIKVMVLEVKGRQVKIGIEAPAHVPVHREEVYAKIQEENLRAAGVPDLEALASYVKAKDLGSEDS